MQYIILSFSFFLTGAFVNTFAQSAQDSFDSFKRHRLSNADSALYFAMRTIESAQAENNYLLLVKGNNAAGYICKETGKLQQAIDHHLKAYENADNNTYVDQKIFLSNNLGLAYYDLGCYDKALEYYLLSLDLRETKQDNSKIGVVKNNIGLVYYKLKQYNKAIQFFEETKVIELQHQNIKGSLSTDGNIALCLIGLQRYDEAIDIYNSIISNELAKDSSLLVETFSGLGIAFFNKSDDFGAVENFLLSEQYATGFRNKMGRVVNNHYLALIALKSEQFDSSEYYLSTSINLAKELNSVLWLKNNYLIASKLEELLGNHEAALAYHKQHKNLRDSLINGKVIENVNNLQHNYDIKKQEEYLASIDTNLSRTVGLNILLGIFFVLSVAFGLFYFFSSARSKKTNKLISKAYADVEYKKQILENHIANEHVEGKSNIDVNSFIIKTTEDLKDPLEHLKGLCNIAMVDVTDPLAITYFNKVEISSDRINSILNRLDDIYYLINSRRVFTNINLHEFTTDIINSIDRTLRSDVLYNIVIPNDLLIKSDYRFLRIALKNIICNAFKFRNKNSEDLSFVSIAYKETEGQHMIIVIDNGYGIEEEDIRGIFNLFGENEDNSNTGLHLSALAIQHLKGNIYVDSIPLVRTTFTISLPVHENIEAEA